MNILSRFTARSMRKNPSRTLVTVLGVILSAAMFAAVTTLTISFWKFMVDSTIHRNGDYFIHCAWLRDEEMEAVKEKPEITRLSQLHALGYLKTQEDSDGPLSTFLVAACDESYFDSMPVYLSQGRYPRNSGELLIYEEILPILESYGMNIELGGSLSMELLRRCDAFPQVQGLKGAETAFQTQYTVVGYLDSEFLTGYGLEAYAMLTLADGQEGLPLWHNAYLKTAPKDVWGLLEEKEFHDVELNDSLLALYGETRYDNFNTVLTTLTVVLCLIIMLGSVSLIYNAFSISVAERSKQFGLLACVGATKKQLRRTVYTEALYLGLLGIPFGLLCGYGGIYVTLWALEDHFAMFLGDLAYGVQLKAVLSPLALGAAAVIALVTVLLSAAIPARRATRISPLEAIRQNRDYRIPKRMKARRRSVFGLPATLAKSYYRVSRGKYRATLISLVISLVLFLSASGFTQALNQTADYAISEENFDFQCFEPSVLPELRQQDFIEKAAYGTQTYYLTRVEEHKRSEEFLQYREALEKVYPQAVSEVMNVMVYYLEDQVLREYLDAQGLDAESYLDPEQPKALLCNRELTTYMIQKEDGTYERYTYLFPPFAEEVEELLLFRDGVPQALAPQEWENGYSYGHCVTEEGELVLSVIPLVTDEKGRIWEDPQQSVDYVLRWEQSEGAPAASYYLMDKSRGVPAQEPSYTEPGGMKPQPVGVTIEELPFGISVDAKQSAYYNALILPLSAAPEELREDVTLYFTVTDYAAARAYLQRVCTEGRYIDYEEEEETARTMLLVIDVFSYGFIVLICLICIANIFNTLSTNVALRRRDFGMLRSVGFRNEDLRNMLAYECLTYGSKALLWGLPVGLLCNGWIQRISESTLSVGYVFPLKAVITAVISVFAIVFPTMFYAASRLRKDNPIEAIRQENL